MTDYNLHLYLWVMSNLTKIFLEAVKEDQKFHQAVEIVRRNCQGKFWLIGGGLFRNIVKDLYGIKIPLIKDFDFIVEKPNSKFDLPQGWKVSTNSFGNPKLISPDNLQVDFVYLDNLHQLRLRGLEPSIERYLETTPLTVQSIVFDFSQNKLFGPVGIKAITSKTVATNDLEWAKWYVKTINLTIEEYIKREADRLNFKPVYP